MDHIVDLDELAIRLRQDSDAWRAVGTVTEFTWRDELGTWPHTLTSDRTMVSVPESLGFKILRDPFLEFHFVAWVGGWADVSYFKGAHIISAAPTFSSVEEAAAVTQREIDRFAE